MNGSMVIQPYTHFNVIGAGFFTLGNEGKICIGQGGEVLIPSGGIFKYGGGTIDLMYNNACLGLFGGTMEILSNSDLLINKGVYFQTEESHLNLNENSSLIIEKSGKFIYESGTVIRLESTEKLVFEEGSRLSMNDGHKDVNAPAADPHLSVILDCGVLMTNWNATAFPSKITNLNIYITLGMYLDFVKTIYIQHLL